MTFVYWDCALLVVGVRSNLRGQIETILLVFKLEENKCEIYFKKKLENIHDEQDVNVA